MRFIAQAWSVFSVALVLVPIGYSLHVMTGWTGFFYGFGVGAVGVLIGNIWYDTTETAVKVGIKR